MRSDVPCRTAPWASNRCRRKHSRRWTPWTRPGAWCGTGARSRPTRSSRGRWKAAPDEERDLWQGLAQICVGLTHAARGNSVGRRPVARAGHRPAHGYQAADGPTYGLDLTAVIACARSQAGTGG